MPSPTRPSRSSRDLADHFEERILNGEIPTVGFALADPSRWRVEQAIARSFLSYVKFGQDSEGLAFFWGFLSVRSRHGTEHGPFTIRVVYPPQFPESGVVPSVFLMSHRDGWRTGHDSHIEPHWKLCLYVPGESEIDFHRPDSLADLLATTVIFLRKEVIYQRALERQLAGGQKATWPGEDRVHGTEGLVQAVRDRGGMRPEEPCICGSGLVFGTCCKSRTEGRFNGEEETSCVPRNNRKTIKAHKRPRRQRTFERRPRSPDVDPDKRKPTGDTGHERE